MSTARTSITQTRLEEYGRRLLGVAARCVCVVVMLLVGTNNTTAQENMRVKSFEQKENDTTPFSQKKLDQNGEPYSLIRIQTTEEADGFAVEAGSVSVEIDKEKHIGEIWVWIGNGATRLTLRHVEFGTCEYRFKSKILKQRAYEMNLETPKTVKIMRELRVSTNPMSMKLLLGDGQENIHGGSFTKNIAAGIYDYVAEADGYYQEKGKIRVSRDDAVTKFSITLKPKMGKLSVHTNASNAHVYVDDKLVYNSSLNPVDVQVGTHSIKVVASGYYDQEKAVVVDESRTRDVQINLIEKARVSGPVDYIITTNPEGANVYVDGKFLGTTPMKNKTIMTGLHKILVQKSGYKNYEETVTVKDRGMKYIALEKLPYTIYTTPSGASVKIDGKSVFVSPVSLTLADGVHSVAVTKDGYRSKTTNITVGGASYHTTITLKQKRTLSESQLSALKNKVYVEGYTQLKFGSSGTEDKSYGAALGCYLSHFNGEAFFSINNAETEAIYWTEKLNAETIVGKPIKCTYQQQYTIGGKVGFAIHESGIVRFALQGGADFVKLKASNKNAPAHGAYSINGLASARLSLGMRSGLYLAAVPEYSIPILRSEGYKRVSEVLQTVDSWSKGFQIKLGVGLIF